MSKKVNKVDGDEDCVFCERIAKGQFEDRFAHHVMFEPLNPVTPGHKLIVPEKHTANLNSSQLEAEQTGWALRYFTNDLDEYNLITSKGSNATQTIQHLHFHIVPRTKDDGLALPWTEPTGDVGQSPAHSKDSKGVLKEKLDEILARQYSMSILQANSDNRHREYAIKQILDLFTEVLTEAKIDVVERAKAEVGKYSIHLPKGQPKGTVARRNLLKKLDSIAREVGVQRPTHTNQVLTELLKEMEKNKVPDGTECNCCDECSNSVPWETGVNAGISECQRVIREAMK